MNLYQACYTRRGRQGEGAGWSVVCPSEDMSQAAREGFAGLAGNLAKLANGGAMPGEVFGVFRHDRFVYFMNINYQAGGREAADARGVSFTHGYCFNLADYHALCERPEQLLAEEEGTFLKEYDPSVKALPVAHELNCGAMDYEGLMKKHRLSAEGYRRLLIGATCALAGFTDSLCVKADRPLDEYGQLCREIMYLIMHGLPYHLRTRLTFCSYKGGKTGVYFSDKAEGNNYFDLDTGEYACDKSRLERYQFTQVYSLEDDRVRQRLLRAMAAFIDQAFDLQLKDIGCDQVEHGFQSQIKNELGKAIDRDLTIPLLAGFLGLPLKEGEAVEEYLAVLLESISENNLQMEDTGLLDRVVNRAQDSANQALRRAYLIFYARQIIAMEDREGHTLLWRQYNEDREQYAVLIGAVKRMDEGYYWSYFERAFLPSRLRSLGQFRSYLEESGGEAVTVGAFNRLLKDVTARELEAAQDFGGLLEVRSRAAEVASLIAKTSPEGGKQYQLYADFLLWKDFEISWFSPEDAGKYRKCSLDELARYGFHNKVCQNAQMVKDLLEMTMDFRFSSERIYGIFFTDEIFDDIAIKKVLQDILRKEQMKQCRFGSRDEVEMSLVCHYDLEKGGMETARWIRRVLEAGQSRLLTPEKLPMIVGKSRILSDERLKGEVMTSLEEELAGKAWKMGRENDRSVKRAMELLLACLNGEELESSDDRAAERNFRFCLHKLAVGGLGAVAIAFFVWCLLKYAGMDSVWGMAAGIAAAVGALGAVAMRIRAEGGIGNYRRNMGMEQSSRLAVMGGIGATLAALAAGLWFLVRKLPALQTAAGADWKTIIAAAGCGLFALAAIAGTAAAIVPDDGEEA